MKDTPKGGYAFPHIIEHLHEPVTAGMELRDYFAAKALANKYTQNETMPDKVAEWAYAVADAMLKAREVK
jgi:hypothetical protein